MKSFCKRNDCFSYKKCLDDHTERLMNNCMSNRYKNYEKENEDEDEENINLQMNKVLKYNKYTDWSEIVKLVGEENLPECITCGGRGEYLSNFGIVGCQLCNSRCFELLVDGKREIIDWGDIIIVSKIKKNKILKIIKRKLL